MASKENIDVNSLPKGLTQKELLKQPELKKINSWFTWAGVVQILTGLINMGQIGQQAAQLEQSGYKLNSGVMALFSGLFLFLVVTGILLLVMRSTAMAYVVGISAIAVAIYALSHGGTVGVGIVAAVLAIAGATKLQKVWREYQAVQ